MRIRLAIPDHLVTPEIIEAALEATTLANAQSIAHGEVPTLTDAISGGLKWRPEPFLDGEHFDLAHQVVSRGWGDCDDLAPWLASELRATGEDEGARTRIYSTGPNRYHAVVQTSDGEILDPSRWAGMGKKSAAVSGVGAAVTRPFAQRAGGALCVMPHKGKWLARCDVPWGDDPVHFASHARARTPEAALDRAIAGAVSCGDAVSLANLDRARVAGQLMLSSGADVLGCNEPEVGNIFGSILKAAKGAAGFVVNPAMALGLKTLTDKHLKPLRNAAANAALPGFGGGLANMGDSVLHSLTHGKGGGRVPGAVFNHRDGGVSVPIPRSPQAAANSGGASGMTLYYHPAGAIGPVIMRF